MRRLAALSLIALAPPAISAEYTFTALRETGQAKVTVRVATPAKAFRLPAWAPGDYDLINYGRFVGEIAFKQGGKEVSFERTDDPNLWRIPGGADEVVYTAKPPSGNFSPNLRVTATQTFVNGSGLFGWFEGDQRNRQSLRVSLRPGDAIYCTLDRVAGGPAGYATFEAYDFDEMIDAPFVAGTGIRAESFEVDSKKVSVVGYNRAENADLAGFLRVGRMAVEAGKDLFGELPYPRYTFYCDFGGGGGGLEHLNSTKLGLSTRARGENASGLLFHEYFHLYNVKRIREKPLGPFDYTKPAIVHTIWWLEGVTDYYADILQYRAGLNSRAETLVDWARSLASMGRNPNRLKVSAEEASLRVWETHGSYGFGGISYYEKGKLVGLCLDLAIRAKSNGKASLDDVIRQLYEECKNRKPGYPPERIRELCIKYGGPELGPIYDVCAKSAVDLPVADLAREAGMIWSDTSGFSPDPMAPASAMAIGAQWPSAIGK